MSETITAEAAGSGDAASAATSAVAIPTFAVRPYRPDGGFDLSGIVLVTGAMLLAGGAMGYVVYLVSKLIYLILVFPVFTGFILGAIGTRMVSFARLRNAWIGGLAGFLGGVLAMTSVRYFAYQELRTALDSSEQVREVLALPADEQRALLESPRLKLEQRQWLQELFAAAPAAKSFGAYMDYRAQQGVRISHGRGSGSGINLGYYGTYIYWMVEVLIVGGTTLAMVRGAAAEPYCLACNQWKRDERIGYMAGSAQDALAAVNGGNPTALLAAQPSVSGDLQLTAVTCPHCGERGEMELRLEQLVHTKDKTEKKLLALVTYPGQALAAVKAAMMPVEARPEGGGGSVAGAGPAARPPATTASA